MSTTFTGDGNYLVISDNGIKRITLPKRKTVVRIDGSLIEVEHDGKYRYSALYSDVTSPASASVEALRASINTILNAT